MPAATASERKEKYDRKRAVSFAKAYEGMIVERQPRLDYMTIRAMIDAKVARILTKHGVVGAFRIKYHNFGRKIEKLHRTGNLSEKAIEAVKSAFMAIGCDEEILNEIIKDLTGTESM